MAAHVYSTFDMPDYGTLRQRNRDFLRALAQAHTATAYEITDRGASVARERDEVMQVIKRQVDGLMDNIETVVRATTVLDDEIALMTATMPEKRSTRIIKECCKKHGVSLSEILSERRRKPIVMARQEAMYRLYDETNLSLPQIGKTLGGRDHTTALHGCRAHAERTGLPHVVKPKGACA